MPYGFVPDCLNTTVSGNENEFPLDMESLKLFMNSVDVKRLLNDVIMVISVCYLELKIIAVFLILMMFIESKAWTRVCEWSCCARKYQ
jgi:hypothetical protein